MLQEDGGTSTNAINQENPKTFIPMPIVMEKQGETTNDMILQQTLPKIPISEKFKREASSKSKFLIDQPLRTSIDSWKEEENHMTNDKILQRPMSHILTSEKLESHFIKSKLMVCQENVVGSGSNGGPIRRSPNRTITRYQPFGKATIDPNNNQGSQRHIFSL
ncbi:hypothetical protein KY285_001376 [Solanum tuberosum]|nr:hypothetical protein KY285_001376 [Solanum tuberosum]